MPTMHGVGMNHHVHWQHEWKFARYISHLLAKLFGHDDHIKLKKSFDNMIAIVGLIGPIMTLPQIFNVWMYQQVSGLSIWSFGTYCVTSTFWLAYGILHRERPIILVNIGWILANVSIVVGILLFR